MSEPTSTIGVIGFPFSKGQPRGGTELGPVVLRDGGILGSVEGTGHKVVDHGDLDVPAVSPDPPEDIVKNPRTVGAANKLLSDKVAEIVKSKQTALVLGGDHSMGIGAIHGHAQAEPNLIVIWVDAHADINTPKTTPSGNIHGMPLSFLVHELSGDMIQLPGFEWCQPCLAAKDLVYIGLRDVDPGERTIIKKLGIHQYSMQEVDKYGMPTVVEMALKQVDPDGNRPIHLSFDVDGMDSTITPATGTPVSGGLTLRESFYLAEEVAETGRLSVLVMSEVNPKLSDKEGQEKTVRNAIDVTTKFFGQKRQGNEAANNEV